MAEVCNKFVVRHFTEFQMKKVVKLPELFNSLTIKKADDKILHRQIFKKF